MSLPNTSTSINSNHLPAAALKAHSLTRALEAGCPWPLELHNCNSQAGKRNHGSSHLSQLVSCTWLLVLDHWVEWDLIMEKGKPSTGIIYKSSYSPFIHSHLSLTSHSFIWIAGVTCSKQAGCCPGLGIACEGLVFSKGGQQLMNTSALDYKSPSEMGQPKDRKHLCLQCCSAWGWVLRKGL